MEHSDSKNSKRDDTDRNLSPTSGCWARLGFSGILLVYLVLSCRFILVLPLWGAVHDEPLHFGYCKYLAVRGRLPRIGEGIFTDPRRYYATPSPGEAAHHPPGYYFLGSLVCRLLSGSSMATQNYALRCLSLLLGLAALLFLFAACRELCPDNPALSLAAVAVVAVFPHWLMMSSVIYVETFGAMATTGALWMLARYAREPRRISSLYLGGAFVGLMALSKMTLLAFCLAFAWMGIALVFQNALPTRKKVMHLIGYLGAMTVVAGWWYARNLVIYGQLFPTSVVAGQLESAIKVEGHPADMLTLLFIPLGRFYYSLAFTGAFHSFWCPTDWLPPVTRPFMYSIAALIWVVTPFGLWRGVAKRDADLVWMWHRFILPFFAGFAVFFFLYVRWTVTVAIQAHGEFGKFIMPVFGCLAMLFVVALKELMAYRWAIWITLGFVVFFLLWDWLAMHHLTTVLIPLHGTTPLP